jgi:hypothetical protein
VRLSRRLAVLEAIAEEARYRPHRILAAERGIDPEALIARCKQLETERDRLRAEGKTDREIVEATAARMGVSTDELWRRAGALVERCS